MRFLRNTLGYCIAGFCIGRFWSVFTKLFGPWGGWLSALVITGSLWYVNHYRGLIVNKAEAAFVDMGLGIGVALFFRSALMNETNSMAKSLPSLFCVALGAVAGGVVTGFIAKKNQYGESFSFPGKNGSSKLDRVGREQV